ncbi:N-acetylglucosamine-6-phosphate deacetylase [Thalassotalea fusca]
MTQVRIHASRLFDGQNYITDQVLTVENGVIVGLDNHTQQVDHYVEGLVVPGYIDIQVNGGGGVLFNDSPSLDKIKTIIAAHSFYGTTAMLPTLITDKVEVMAEAADAMAMAIAEKIPGIVGIHFEGPHLSVAKKGAHSAEYIREITAKEWEVLSRKDLGQIIVTLAPETVSPEDIKRMVSLGIKVCLGHTNADFNTAQQAVDAGADGFTHLFNAMSPIQGREPGVTGCALLNDSASTGIIVDGHHVDYATCRLAMKTKPQGKVLLVTDAMPPVGTNDDSFAFFNRTVHLNDGKLTSTTGELAGSVLDMATAVKNTYEKVGVTLEEALRMASFYPAQYINQGHIRGLLKIGYQADFTVLDSDLNVKSTWIAGELVTKS